MKQMVVVIIMVLSIFAEKTSVSYLYIYHKNLKEVSRSHLNRLQILVRSTSELMMMITKT